MQLDYDTIIHSFYSSYPAQGHGGSWSYLSCVTASLCYLLFIWIAGVLCQLSNIVIADTGIMCEHNTAVDKLSANWQSRNSCIPITYYITTIFPALFFSHSFIAPPHPLIDSLSNGTDAFELIQLIK